MMTTSKVKYKFRSGFEKGLASSLDSRGIKYSYEDLQLPYVRKQKVPTKVREIHGLPSDFSTMTYHKYTPDFLLENGIVVEAKGRFKSSDRTKMLAVCARNPHLDIRMVFQRDQRLYPGSTTTYSEWCDLKGIKYSVGKIPSAWAEEASR